MKRAIMIVAVLAFAATGAFGQIVFGVSAQQYYQRDANGDLPNLSEAWDDFRDGQGVYWGGFAEFIFEKLGIGLSFNQQTYKYEPDSRLDMWNYDVNVYLSYHLFGGDAFLDPFVQAGIGQWGFGYTDTDAARYYYPDLTDDPLAASNYADIGLGLGLNLEHVGIFFKAMWSKQSDEPVKTNDGYDTAIWELPVMPFKWVFGAKILL